MDYNSSRRFIKARNSWLYRQSPGRARRMRGVMLHATRGGRSAGDDGPGTENWASNASNGAAFWDWLAYENGQQVLCTEGDEEPLWAAGYGAYPGTWSAQDYYYQFELAQGRPEDPYPAEQIESAAQWVGGLFKERGWPVQRIPFLYQTEGSAPPFGICTHEDSANGRRLGKSDPGPMFPWNTFLARARIWAGQALEDDLSAADIARIDRLERVMGAWGIHVTATATNLAVLREAAGDHLITVGLLVPLKEEAAMTFLDKMGMSLYGGLALNQQAISSLAEVVQSISPIGGALSDDQLADALRRIAGKLSGREGLAAPPALLLPPTQGED